MATTKRCPKCGHQEFSVNAHVVQEWLVDADGDFISTLAECVETTHRPDDDDIWSCSKCGFEAAGKDFNVKIKDIEKPPELVQELLDKLNHDRLLVTTMCDWRLEKGQCQKIDCPTCPMRSILKDAGVVTDPD